MMLLTRKSLTLAVLASAFALGACGGKEAAPAAASGASGASAATTEAKTYIVGTDAAYAPFEYQDDKGEVTGFSRELLEAIGSNQGLSFKFVNTPWEGIFATLGQGDRDLVISSVTITDERKQTMDFSDPYFEATQMIAVGEKGKDIKSFADLKGRLVSVQNGTTGDLVVQKLLGKDSKDIKRFESLPLALKELTAGGVDAAVGDNGVVQNFVTNNPDTKLRTMVDNSFEKEYYGIAVKKGRSDDLLPKINAGLKAIKADGTYDKIYAKWFAGDKAPAASAPAAASAASQ